MKLKDRLIVLLITLTMLLSGTGVQAFADSGDAGAADEMQTQEVSETVVEEPAKEAEAPEEVKEEKEVKEESEAPEAQPAVEEEAEEASEKAAEEEAPAVEEAAQAQDEEVTEETAEAVAEEEEEEIAEPAEEAEEEGTAAGTLTKTVVIDGVKACVITVSYGEDAEIPEGAELRVKEIPENEYKTYLNKAAKTLDVDVHSIAYTRLFDISIVKGGKEFQPDDKVKVKVELREAENLNDVQVIHFEERANGKTVPEELNARTSGKTVSFETEGFSTFSFVDYSLEKRTVTADADVKSGKLFENDDIILTGMMPARGIVEAERVDAEIEGQNTLVAYDIKIYADETMRSLGINWQPGEEPIKVTVKSDAIDAGRVNIYHMATVGSEPERVATDVAVKDGGVTFKAESFSVYPVTEDTTKPRIFYTFYNDGETLASEYITKISEFYDPGVSPDYGQTFLGWAYDPAETNESKIYSFDELKEQLEEKLSTKFTDGTEIKVYAKFKEAYYLRYMVADGEGNVGVLKSDSIRTDASNKSVKVNCEYSGSGETFEGWINATDGTVYQNGDKITLDCNIDLYAKVAGRSWLIFNSNASEATFTSPQLIYGDFVTSRPDDPTRKGYLFKGWNTKADGSGEWWYKTDGIGFDRFGGKITEDTTLYAQWEGAPNSFTVIYWKQKAADEAGLANSKKTYDYIESVTVEDGVKTGDAIELPEEYNKKATLTDDTDYYYQTKYSHTDWKSTMTVGADGSSVVNVYYDRLAYHLYFQIEDYVYTESTNDKDNNPYKYGDVNGKKARVYWYNNAFRTSNSKNGTVYTGTVYTRSSYKTWTNIKDIYGLFGHEIIDEFPIVGTNGVEYEAARWDPQTNSVGWSEVMSIIISVPAGNVTFHLDTAERPTKTVNYYVEALSGTSGTVSAPSTLYDKDSNKVTTSKKFVLYKSVGMKYNGVTIEDLLAIPGMSLLGTDSTKNTNGFWVYDTSSAGTLNVYYSRNRGKIDFVSQGAYVTSNKTTTVTSVPFGAKIRDYLPNDPTNGEDGYYFDGWYKDQACSEGLEITDSDMMPDGNARFYAKWSTYRVRVVLDPGCTDFWFANNQELSFRTDYGDGISFSNIKPGVAQRPGYKLTGWYYTPDFREGTEVNTDNPYVITKKTPGVNMKYQSTDDWKNNTYGDNDGVHGSVKGILKLYARWQLDIKEGTVYFLYEVEDGYCIFDASGNNQTVVPVDSTGHALGTSFRIASAPTGYNQDVDFTNWMVLGSNGGATSVVYNAGDTVTLTEDEWKDYIDVITVTDTDGNVGIMNVVRLRARFMAKADKSTTIVFHGNGGTMKGGAESYTQVVPLNATIDLAAQSEAFTRKHYSLTGWNTEADGSGTSFKANEKVYADNEGLEDGQPNELYAMWIADIEIVASGAKEEVIYDGEEHSNEEPYTFSYTLGGKAKTRSQLSEMGIRVDIASTGWPVATGTEKGSYVAADLSDKQLANLISIDADGYEGNHHIKRVYEPAELTIRDLMLTINKTVTGSAADTNKPFTVTLKSVEGMESGSFTGTVTHVIEGTTNEATFEIGSSFWMRDGDVVKIEGLPQGKEVVFTEDNNGYETTWKLNDEEPIDGTSASIRLEEDSELEIIDELEEPDPIAPTGITTRETPYWLILAAAVMMIMLIFVVKKLRDRESEEDQA